MASKAPEIIDYYVGKFYPKGSKVLYNNNIYLVLKDVITFNEMYNPKEDPSSWLRILENYNLYRNKNAINSFKNTIEKDKEQMNDYRYKFPFYLNNSVEGTYLYQKQFNPNINERPVKGIYNNLCYSFLPVGASFTFSGRDIKNIYLNNPYQFKLDGFTISCMKAGSTSLKIIFNDGTYRTVGIFSESSFIPDLEFSNRLLLGSVSEHDRQHSLPFWEDFDTKDKSSVVSLFKNKYCDLHYIYLNGGPLNGWRTNWIPSTPVEEQGRRAVNFIRNCQRLGSTPCLVYYNIPTDVESYETNRANLQNPNYMKEYFNDLNFALNIVNSESPLLPVMFIIEPDFLGYILQNETDDPDKVLVSLSSVSSLGLLELTSVNLSLNNLTTFVKAVNTLIKKKCPHIILSWKQNLWSTSRYSEPGNVMGLGICKVRNFVSSNEEAKKILDRQATILSNFLKKLGLDKDNDYTCFDKYGLDFAIFERNAIDDPSSGRWSFNLDDWFSYLYFTTRVSEMLGHKLILWQLPAGYLNDTLLRSPYTMNNFSPLKNQVQEGEDSSINFVFGAYFRTGGKRLEYFSKDNYHGGNALIRNSETIIWKDFSKFLLNNRVCCVMFGAGVGTSTSNLPMIQTSGKSTDNNYCITRFQNYYLRNM